MTTNEEWVVPRSRMADFHKQISDDLLAAAERVLFSDFWDGVAIADELESAFCKWRKYQFATALSSGSAAITIGLRALGVKPGDQVITVPNADMADTNAIEECGAEVVLCDVNSYDFNINVDLVEDLISEKTSVIMPVSLFGHPANVKALREIADRNHVKILEDAALSGASMDYGKNIGFFADAVAFSTAMTKPLSAATFGGIIATADRKTWERCKMFANYGLWGKSTTGMPDLTTQIADGYNLRMHPMDAACFIAKIPYFDEQFEKRIQVSKYYEEHLKGLHSVIIPVLRKESLAVRREYPIRVISPDGSSRLRNYVWRELDKKRVQCVLGYTPDVTQRPVAKLHNYKGANNIPISRMLSNQIICLPHDFSTTEDEVIYICDTIKNCVINNLINCGY